MTAIAIIRHTLSLTSEHFLVIFASFLFFIEHWKVRSTLVFHILWDFSVCFCQQARSRSSKWNVDFAILILYTKKKNVRLWFRISDGILDNLWIYNKVHLPLVVIISKCQDNQLRLQIIIHIEEKWPSLTHPSFDPPIVLHFSCSAFILTFIL